MSPWQRPSTGSRGPAQPERLAKTLVIELDGWVVGRPDAGHRGRLAQHEVAEQAKAVEAEIGYVLDPSYGGRGCATEAVETLLRLCFENLGLRRVTAGPAPHGTSW